jgi:hypothetical protein
VIVLPSGIKAAFRRALFSLFGHNASSVRFCPQGNAKHLVCCRHLKIERLVNLGLQPRDIGVSDVSPVFAQMRSDTVGSCCNRELRGIYRIGMPSASSVTDSCDMIDVDAEAKLYGHVTIR